MGKTTFQWVWLTWYATLQLAFWSTSMKKILQSFLASQELKKCHLSFGLWVVVMGRETTVCTAKRTRLLRVEALFTLNHMYLFNWRPRASCSEPTRSQTVPCCACHWSLYLPKKQMISFSVRKGSWGNRFQICRIFLSQLAKKMFCLKAEAVKMYNTMWDGKSCTAIANTFLGTGKKLASNTCHVCLATPLSLQQTYCLW